MASKRLRTQVHVRIELLTIVVQLLLREAS